MTKRTEFADFRSDTFTLPDQKMRDVIYRAEVGNSGYDEDPSVTLLEQTVADFFSVEAALYLPSATMAGQIAIRVWTQPGDMVVLEEYGHSYYFETGAMSAISGAQAHLVKGQLGLFDAQSIAPLLKHMENPLARTGLVIVENTSNYGGGTVYPRQQLQEIFDLCAQYSIPVHVDGARIWNALAVDPANPAQVIAPGGSMSVCFSKGLGAPMGALLLGTGEFIYQARRVQQMLGGVMRQVGFMAAAALYAFENNRQRLAEDHENARLLATGLAEIPGLELDMASVQTNMVYVDVIAGTEKAEQLVSALAKSNIGVFNLGNRIRLVTSMLVNREDCEKTITAFRSLLDAGN